jgi:hypothetical protein
MPSSVPDDPRTEAAVWQAMVLFSTLSTATEVWSAAEERRAGHDPSTQEDAGFVRPYLREANGELQALLMRLRASLVYADQVDDGRVARLVRRFNDLSTVHRAARVLHVMHQRLLSLYPDVPEEVVEEARVLYGQASDLLDVRGMGFVERLEIFSLDALRFAGHLHRALVMER